MCKICIFAGTTEARRLVELLSTQPVSVTACVATEYGETLLPEGGNVTVRSGRIPVDGIIQMLSDTKFDLVIDATHPYAASITESVARACAETGTEYLRLLREESDKVSDFTCVLNAEAAALFLSKTDGNILLTTGSKDLKTYSKVKDFTDRAYARVLPLDASLALCREAGVLFHTDAVQAAGHLPIDVKAQNIDLLSLSAHKFHGPKGTGVLYARQGVFLTNLIGGGSQERGKRAGTENIPAIMGMAAALEDACAHLDENAKRVSALRDRLIDGLSKIPHSALNGDPVNRLPGNVSFCFEGVEGESLLLLLDAKGICASSGSACTSGSLDPSHVLLAIGRPHDVAHGSLRLSLCEWNTDEEIDRILEAVPEVVEYLRGMSPLWKDLVSGKKPFTL